MPTISTCAACGKVFSSVAMFDAHRIGDFEKPIYAPTDPTRKRVIGYQPPNRRCLTTDELQVAGYRIERRMITIYREGIACQVEREVWYDPAARAQMPQVFTPAPVEVSSS